MNPLIALMARVIDYLVDSISFVGLVTRLFAREQHISKVAIEVPDSFPSLTFGPSML